MHLLFALIPCTHTPVEPSPCHVKPEAPSSTTHDSPWDTGGNWLREGHQLALGHTASKERGWEHRGAGVRRIKRKKFNSSSSNPSSYNIIVSGAFARASQAK